MYRRGGPGLIVIVYVIIGAFIAGTHGYFASVGSLHGIIAALLAIALWPLVLLGISFKEILV
jgi:hypothetical protein